MGRRRRVRTKKRDREDRDFTGGGGDDVEAAFRAAGGVQSTADTIRPTGRAPRGQGAEYAARRKIANRLDSVSADMNRQSSIIARDQGQRAMRVRGTRARDRREIMRRTFRDIERVATGAGGWEAKADIVEIVYKAGRAEAAGLA